MFPRINTIDDVLPYIQGRPEFTVTEKVSSTGFKYIVINYHVALADTFTAGTPHENAIRRECRGIIFDGNANHIIIRRPYHKFFNLDEKESTSFENVNKKLFSSNYTILEKLDGSMIAPFLDSTGNILLGTKMGETDISDQVKKYLQLNDFLNDFYNGLNTHCSALIRSYLEKGETPIFEWCSRENRIVIDHPKPRLILTAIRSMVTGEYLKIGYDIGTPGFSKSGLSNRTYFKSSGIEFIGPKQNLTIVFDQYIQQIRDLKGQEGVVIRFDDGEMVKIKADEYCTIHKAKDTLTFEKNILKLVLENKIDDLIPILPKEAADRVSNYNDSVLNGIKATGDRIIKIWLDFIKVDRTKKEFALHVLKYHSDIAAILFKVWEGGLPLDVVRNYCLKFTSSNSKIEEIRHIIQANWNHKGLEDAI